MLVVKHHQLFILLYVFFVCLFTSIEACNIWKASDCPQPPTADDEEIFKYDLYTREQLFKFCGQGKKYIECVNKHLQCCDLRSEHTGALAAFEVGLQQAGWRLGRHCAGLGGNTIIQYKCKTTTPPLTRTTTTTRSTTTTIPPCEVEEAGRRCNEILDNRLKFETIWSVSEKIQWCQAVRDYVQCAEKHITNCSISEVRDDVNQLSNFMEYLKKHADLHCQGGFYGCEYAFNDVRCVLSPQMYYSGKAFDSATGTSTLNWYLFFSLALTCFWTR